MHAVLLTLIALGGGVDAYASDRITQSSAEIYGASATEYGSQGASYSAGYGGSCGPGGCGTTARHHEKGARMGGWLGHMPQTCYSPRYGCYFGGNRHMSRYPAFHGTFYRRPYNYRNLFDYPWHAEMHEPTSMFSYNVAGEAAGGATGPALGPAIGPEIIPPMPQAESFDAAQRMPRTAPAMMLPGYQLPQTAMRPTVPAGAYRQDKTSPSARPGATLRR